MVVLKKPYKEIKELKEVTKIFMLNAKILELLGEEVIYDIEKDQNGFHSTFNSMNPNSVMIKRSGKSITQNLHLDDSFMLNSMHNIDEVKTGRNHELKKYFVEIDGVISFEDSLNLAFIKSYLPYLEKKNGKKYSENLLGLKIK